ncbi:hypothetical protein RBSH_03446 [Rhodopirellula baltica SH28]|uniref:Transmembrane protein n=1 Tax=Rhodopirellula baltica SH28 TaxID=993517 RepID=K5D3L1_RHOBT|nr:hypothetical protein [Rhodopirellula baltica]EKK01207.1 hypothetical protein RBSH_03446 [Rhodopirellula baltica SH28]
MVDEPSSGGDFRPFAVQCVSCQSRLKVSNPSLIGTIVNCPKCNSFVQVDPPQHAPTEAHPSPPSPPRVTLGDESIGSEAMTEAGMSVDDFPTDSSDAAGDSGPLVAPPLAGEASFESDESGVPETTGVSESVSSESAVGVDPSELYRARRSGISKSVALWIVGSLLSVTLMAGLFVWFRQPDQSAGSPAAGRGIDLDASDEPIESAPENGLAGSNADADSNEGDPAPDSNVDISDANATVPDGPDAVETSADTSSGDSSSDGMIDAGIPGSDGPDASGVPNDLMPRSPLDGPAAVLGRDQPNAGPVAKPPATESAPDPVMELPPEFAQFQILLEMPGQAPDAPPMSEAPVLEDVVLDIAAEEFVDPMLIATPPEEVNIETALKMRLAVSTKGYPLSDLILFLGEATLIPIQLDWVSMDLADVDLRQPVATDSKGMTTIGQLLGNASRSAGLEIETEEDRLTLTIPIEMLQAKTKKMIDLEDFGNERGSAQTLLDQLNAVVDLEPRDALHLRCLTTESLRRLRQHEPLLSDDVMSRWSAAYVHQPTEKLVDDGLPPAWRVLSEGKTGTQLDTAIAMAGLLRRTSRINDATCVINWNDAQRRRLSPGQLVMAYAGEAGNEVTAGEMLERVLDPMGLQVREVDSSHWWVGTSATYDRLPVVVRSEPLGPRRDDVLHRIRESARLVGASLAIEHDPVSDGFLAVMPRFLYRQLPKIIGPEL